LPSLCRLAVMARSRAPLVLVAVLFFALAAFMLLSAPDEDMISDELADAATRSAHPCPYADVLGLDENSVNPHGDRIPDVNAPRSVPHRVEEPPVPVKYSAQGIGATEEATTAAATPSTVSSSNGAAVPSTTANGAAAAVSNAGAASAPISNEQPVAEAAATPDVLRDTANGAAQSVQHAHEEL